MSDLADLIGMYETQGGSSYVGEPISQLEHALQSAAQAAQLGATAAMVVAALLHDVGHLLLHDETATRRGVDTRHEDMGSRYLMTWFGTAVTDPIRLHVSAKRYLARDAAYVRTLSEESLRSLDVQGGPMTNAEVARFKSEPCFADALRLRQWDDVAKVTGWAGPGLDSYRTILEEVQRIK